MPPTCPLSNAVGTSYAPRRWEKIWQEGEKEKRTSSFLSSMADWDAGEFLQPAATYDYSLVASCFFWGSPVGQAVPASRTACTHFCRTINLETVWDLFCGGELIKPICIYVFIREF